MKRYIDADKLKESFNKYTFKGNKFTDPFNAYVDNAPTADVVEVVRCKDCKYWKERLPVCERIHRAGWGVNDYCSYGERAEE